MTTSAAPTLPAETPEYGRRLKRLSGRIARRRLGAFLVSGLPNIRYLTGFSGSNGLLLIEPDQATLITDGRYGIQARQQTSGIELIISTSDALAEMVGHIRRRRIRNLAFERNRAPYAAYEFLRRELHGVRLAAIDSLVEQQRAVKEPAEIDRLRAAIDLNSAAFERACEQVRPEWTEARFAAEIEHQMRLLGAEKPAFDTIVASGPRSALPHATPQPVRLSRNAPIVVDQGAILDGYVSDMTRMVCLGALNKAQSLLFRAVREAQAAAIDAVKSGTSVRAVDGRARRVLKKFKLDKAFSHSTGHGVGLEIHEQPRIGARQNGKLASGMVITIEPGVYVEGVGGVRIEDVVLVTPNGCEVLTKTPRALRLL
jgi:Xaa-Pro aminopeptidase